MGDSLINSLVEGSQQYRGFIKRKEMTPIDGYPGLYKTNVPPPGPKKMRRFKNELIENASTPAMAQALRKALKDLC